MEAISYARKPEKKPVRVSNEDKEIAPEIKSEYVTADIKDINKRTEVIVIKKKPG